MRLGGSSRDGVACPRSSVLHLVDVACQSQRREHASVYDAGLMTTELFQHRLRLRAMGLCKKKAELECTFVPGPASYLLLCSPTFLSLAAPCLVPDVECCVLLPANATSDSDSRHVWWPPSLDPLLNRSLVPASETPLHARTRKPEVDGAGARRAENDGGDGSGIKVLLNRQGVVATYHPVIDGLHVYCHPTGVGEANRKFKGKLVQDVTTGRIVVSTKVT